MDQTIDEAHGIRRPWHDSHPQPMRFHHHFLGREFVETRQSGISGCGCGGTSTWLFQFEREKHEGNEIYTARREPNRDDLSWDGARSLSELFPKRGPGEVVRIKTSRPSRDCSVRTKDSRAVINAEVMANS